MIRVLGIWMLLVGAAIAAPKVGEHVGKLGPSGAEQEPAFLLTDEYRPDFKASEKCAIKSADGDVVYIGKKAVYADDKKQGVVVLLDEFARRYALDYCWQ